MFSHGGIHQDCVSASPQFAAPENQLDNPMSILTAHLKPGAVKNCEGWRIFHSKQNIQMNRKIGGGHIKVLSQLLSSFSRERK